MANTYSVRVKVGRPVKTDNPSNTDKVKLIKANLFMRTDKLAKKLQFPNISSLYKFCDKNKIRLSPSKHILNYINKNINTVSVSYIRKVTGYTKQDIYKIMSDNNISVDRFRPVKNTNQNKLIKKTEITNKKIPYEKITHEQLNGILLKHDEMANSFIKDLNSLSIGEALHIKKENWIARSNPYFYFKKLVLNSSIKVRVRDIDDDYYVIRLK